MNLIDFEMTFSDLNKTVAILNTKETNEILGTSENFLTI